MILMDNLKETISIEAQRIEEDSLYSSKGHQHAARRWGKVHLGLGGAIAFLAAISGGTASFSEHNIIAGGIAFIVAGLTALITFLNPNEIAQKHQTAGVNYNCLRNQARIFFQIEIKAEDDQKLLRATLEKLNKERNQLNKDSPKIPAWAYGKAKKSIEAGEASYKVDNE